MTVGAGAASTPSMFCTPPAIIHSMHHQIGSSGMQGFEIAGGLLYLSFLKPFLPDLFITLSTLTNWDLPQLYLNLRGTQVLGSPHYPTVSQCLGEVLWGVLLSSIMTMSWEWGLEREPCLTPDCCGSSQKLVSIFYHIFLPKMTVMVAISGRFCLAEARLVSPHLGMSSGCLPGRILLIIVMWECILCIIFIFLLPFDGVLWGTTGNMSLFLWLLTGQVF